MKVGPQRVSSGHYLDQLESDGTRLYWRITFRFNETDVELVDYQDYH
jgi:plasmid maintenance system killer protein